MKEFNQFVIGDYLKIKTISGEIIYGKITEILENGNLLGTWGDYIATPGEDEIKKEILADLY